MLKTSQTNLTILIFAVVSLLAAQPGSKLETLEGRVPIKTTNGFALKPNAENNTLFDQLFNDEIVETGYTYRYSYSRDNRSVDDTLYYDLISEHGIIKKGKTELNAAYYHGDEIINDANQNIYSNDGLYTSCDLDHPHYSR